MSHLRRLQRSLQERFGGRPQQRVHLTCQRIDAQNAETLRRLQERLRRDLAGIEPPHITATSVILLEHDFWQMTLLRWQIEKTAALRAFLGQLEAACIAVSIVPHYLYSSGWIPSNLTALEEIDATTAQATVQRLQFPQHLFTASQVTISRIIAPRRFEILDVLQLT